LETVGVVRIEINSLFGILLIYEVLILRVCLGRVYRFKYLNIIKNQIQNSAPLAQGVGFTLMMSVHLLKPLKCDKFYLWKLPQIKSEEAVLACMVCDLGPQNYPVQSFSNLFLK
jgi:hypothetical protein